MGRFGENLFGQPIYRVVFSDSRTDLLGGKWPDGKCEYREVPRYPGIRGKWILEKWQSAEEYAGTKEQYNREQHDPDSGLLTCGPYPHRGEYSLCHIFITAPGETMVAWAVHDNKMSRSITPGQRKQGIMDPLEKQEREQGARFDNIWGDAMGPFAGADAVVSFTKSPLGSRAGFKRSGDMPADRFVNAPLPTGDNFFGTIQRRDTIAKLTGEQNA
jgi:hypothetical protein